MDSFETAFHTPQIHILSSDQIQILFQATLTCLRRTGVTVHNSEARELLGNAGAEVDGHLVRIPPKVIEKAVESAPPSFKLFGKHREYDMSIEPGLVRYGPGPTCTYFIDPDTGERRRTKRSDPAITARVCDALANIDFVMSLGLIDDVTPSLACVHEFAQMITNTRKPVLAWAFRTDHLKSIYEIATAVSEGKEKYQSQPNFGFFSTWQAPLIHTDDDVANCLWAVEHGIPIIYLGGGAAGLTGPITGAGLMVTNLACMLSGLAIFQLKKPGAPVCLGALPTPMDLRTARISYGGPEMSLYSAAVSEVAQFLKVPFMGTAGASESKLMDLQAAIESTFQVILAQMSKTNMVHDVGFLDCADIGSLEMLVMTDEIIALAKRVARGIEISDATLMLDLINEVGPGGSFIADPETARRCREEILTSEFMDRNPWDIWHENGAESMLARVKNRLSQILSRPVSVNITDVVSQRIEEIITRAEERERLFLSRNTA